MMENSQDVPLEAAVCGFRKALSFQLKKFVEKGQLNELEEQGAIQFSNIDVVLKGERTHLAGSETGSSGH